METSGIKFLPLVRYRHFVAADEAVLKYYSKTGRLTDCVLGQVWGQGEGQPRPRATD